MIAILMGGNSSERDISLKSGEAVYKSLKNQGVECFKFDWSGDNIEDLWTKKFDKVFIILHGRGGEDGSIQQQLENRSIRFNGSDAKSSKICMDKALTKSICKAKQIPTPPSIIVNENKPIAEINFNLPWVIKPNSEGSSIGISKVDKSTELDQALKLAWMYDKKALIEKWIDGSEYTVAIVEDKALPVVKINFNNELFDYRSKYVSEETKYLCPCELSQSDEQNLQKIALKAFKTIGASGWGRIDFIIDKNNNPYLLEINTIPGLTTHSLVPMAAKAVGMSFDKLITNITNCKSS